MLLGASILASSSTALALRALSNDLYNEIALAICFIGGAVGLFVGAWSAVFSRSIGARIAGVPIEQFELRPLFPFRRGDTEQTSSKKISRSEADRRYGIANKIAWMLLAFVIVTCLWHNAPSWFLMLISLIVGGATIVEIGFKPGLLSPEAVKADANSGLFMLTKLAPLGLTLKAMYRFELVDWHLPLVVAATVGYPATLMQLRPLRGPSGSRVATAFFAIFFCFLGSGSLVWSGLQFANDAASPELIALHRIRISARHEQRGKYDTMYWVNAFNPPDLNGIEKFKLSKATYERLVVGGDACIEVWRGMLRLRWYRVNECEAHPSLVR